MSTRSARLSGGRRMVPLLALAAAAGCGDDPERGTAAPIDDAVVGAPGEIALVPGPVGPARDTFANPYGGDDRAVAEGARLFTWYNCADCHGTLGGGGMGPPLRDGQWIYGGTPTDLYRSIMEGRPEGMPGWLGRIPDDQAWKIVAYVTALSEGGGPPPTLRPPADRVPGRGGGGGISPTEP